MECECKAVELMSTWTAREASDGVFYAESGIERIGPFGSHKAALACAVEQNRVLANKTDYALRINRPDCLPEPPNIWSDPDGEWFQLCSPLSRTSVLFGPFAYTEEDRTSHGAENAYHALIASGWTTGSLRERLDSRYERMRKKRGRDAT